jgi:putative FmdB family regulatory protein
MPLYEYICTECENLEEVLAKVSAPPPAKCPSCGAENTLQKAVSQTSFHLKGGGWYKDLYSSTPAGANEEKGKATAESGKETKGEKKAAKAEAKSEAKAEKPAAKSKAKAEKAA